MRIAILDDYLDAVASLQAFDRLAGHEAVVFTDREQDRDRLAQRLAPFEALVLTRERTRIDAALLERLPALRVISQTGVIPHIDVAACTAKSVAVCTVRTGDSTTTAELTWGLVLASMRHIPQELQALRAGRWQTRLGRGVGGLTLGILGYGGIGALVAGYGRAFNMRVLAWGREGSLARARADGVDVAASQRDLFERSDVLSVHLRMLPQTAGLVTAGDLAAMKPDALFVNTSRAALVEPGALLAALRAGRPGFAAVDVYDREPVDDGADPLLAMDNVICSPHVGYVTRDRLEIIYGTAFDQVLAYAGGRPINVVNPEALAVAR